ncbi:MAG: Stp1/IreP family PP2C-type Ser/Thr phosphatase [Nitrospiraceae bacterium]|nr:MAG: Stp1/IreP family PP2C-type Ser/Thr phosphatase [Nitrospiraceae bacterium]
MSKIISFGKSDVGLRRSNNEDTFIVRPDLGFAAVADGMGGPASGEVASRIFADTALEIFSSNSERSERELPGLVQDVFQLSNERIISIAQDDPRNHGMGCTAEVITFYSEGYVAGHVGDSRTYLLREGKFRQISKDHSVVQDQLDQGLIKPDEARNHALKHVILRAVGVKEDLAVDIIRGKTMPGDIFLLCSDGLTDMLEDAEIHKVLMLPLDLEQKADRLIDLAKAAGGKDNITVALCEVIAS